MERESTTETMTRVHVYTLTSTRTHGATYKIEPTRALVNTRHTYSATQPDTCIYLAWITKDILALFTVSNTVTQLLWQFIGKLSSWYTPCEYACTYTFSYTSRIISRAIKLHLTAADRLDL